MKITQIKYTSTKLPKSAIIVERCSAGRIPANVPAWPSAQMAEGKKAMLAER
jgi:hypothetical protein